MFIPDKQFLKGWNCGNTIQACVLKVGPISQLVMGMPEISFLKVTDIQ